MYIQNTHMHICIFNAYTCDYAYAGPMHAFVHLQGLYTCLCMYSTYTPTYAYIWGRVHAAKLSWKCSKIKLAILEEDSNVFFAHFFNFSIGLKFSWEKNVSFICQTAYVMRCGWPMHVTSSFWFHNHSENCSPSSYTYAKQGNCLLHFFSGCAFSGFGLFSEPPPVVLEFVCWPPAPLAAGKRALLYLRGAFIFLSFFWISLTVLPVQQHS